MICRKPLNRELETISALIAYQFGVDVYSELKSIQDLEICFGSTGRLRSLRVKGQLLASIRASDYHIVPYGWLARLLHKKIPRPRYRLVIVDEMVPDVVGRNTIFAKHVLECDYECCAGDEVFVTDESDKLLGVATLKLCCETIISALRGPAALARFWCVE